MTQRLDLEWKAVRWRGDHTGWIARFPDGKLWLITHSTLVGGDPQFAVRLLCDCCQDYILHATGTCLRRSPLSRRRTTDTQVVHLLPREKFTADETITQLVNWYTALELDLGWDSYLTLLNANLWATLVVDAVAEIVSYDAPLGYKPLPPLMGHRVRNGMLVNTKCGCEWINCTDCKLYRTAS